MQPPLAPPIPPRHVLVVDDDEDVRFAIGRSLKRLGCTATLASSGPEALECLAGLTPSLIMVDVKMRGMDGYEFLRRLPAQDPRPGIIVMTGGLDPAREVTQMPVILLRKPWTPDELRSAVSQVLR